MAQLLEEIADFLCRQTGSPFTTLQQDDAAVSYDFILDCLEDELQDDFPMQDSDGFSYLRYSLKTISQCTGCDDTSENINPMPRIMLFIDFPKTKQLAFSDLVRNHFIQQTVERRCCNENQPCNMNQANQRLQFVQAPLYLAFTFLIFNQKRTKNNGWKNSKIIDKSIDLPMVFSLKGCFSENKTIKYWLCGVVSHTGKKYGEGHYVAYTKQAFDKNWIYFDNQEVESIDENFVGIKYNINCGDIETPYLLFYRQITSNDLEVDVRVRVDVSVDNAAANSVEENNADIVDEANKENAVNEAEIVPESEHQGQFLYDQDAPVIDGPAVTDPRFQAAETDEKRIADEVDNDVDYELDEFEYTEDADDAEDDFQVDEDTPTDEAIVDNTVDEAEEKNVMDEADLCNNAADANVGNDNTA